MPSYMAAGYGEQIHQTDPHLIEEAMILRIGREDDVHALIELYEATERAVYAYILSVIPNPEIAADLVQETYLYVRRSAHLYVLTGKPLAWILGIARKLTKDYLRIHKHNPLRIYSDASFGGIASETDRIILAHALSLLRTAERQVLFLHAAAGLRHREIASCLSIPISAVRIHYMRSVDKLRKRLYEQGVSL